MPTKTETFIKTQLKIDLPDIRPGDTVRVHQKIPARQASQLAGVADGKEKEVSKLQIFEGLVIARKHGKEMGSTITVRKMVSGVGVEKILPLHSPNIDKIEIVKRGKVRRAKLYYLRWAKGKRARLKKKDFAIAIDEPSSVETTEGKEPKEEVSEVRPLSTEEAPAETKKEE